MVCVCSMLTIGSAQAAFAGPSTGYESDMVATVAADLSIYADEDENSEVVAMAEKGESYDVVGKADDSWIKVAARVASPRRFSTFLRFSKLLHLLFQRLIDFLRNRHLERPLQSFALYRLFPAVHRRTEVGAASIPTACRVNLDRIVGCL